MLSDMKGLLKDNNYLKIEILKEYELEDEDEQFH